jgi:hypothetical protein
VSKLSRIPGAHQEDELLGRLQKKLGKKKDELIKLISDL